MDVSVAEAKLGSEEEIMTDVAYTGGHCNILLPSFFRRLMIGQYVTVFGDVISHVNISSVKPDDGGEYECVAENRAGRTSHAARLNVYGK